MYSIEFTPEAIEDLRAFRKHDQQRVVDSIEQQLTHEPNNQTRNRKQLRPNQLAEWELQVGDYRVFYDVDAAASVVRIAAVGMKTGNKLLVHGREFEL